MHMTDVYRADHMAEPPSPASSSATDCSMTPDPQVSTAELPRRWAITTHMQGYGLPPLFTECRIKASDVCRWRGLKVFRGVESDESNAGQCPPMVSALKLSMVTLTCVSRTQVGGQS